MGRLYDAARRLSRRILMAIVVDDGDTPAYPDYLSFTSTGNSTIALNNNGGNAPVVYYSFDRETWTLWDYSALSLTDGQTVYMYGDNGGDGGNFSRSTGIYSLFEITGNLYGGGNVMSLLGEDFEDYTTVGSFCFYKLFNNCTSLASAPNLPATTLASDCYFFMFSKCNSLTTAPDLPATILEDACYRSMFQNCTSLTTTPYLPATTMVNGCYYAMFSGCSNLTKITVGATAWNNSYAQMWVFGVAASGTFVCPAELTIASGNNGIPSGWTRVDL